MNRLKNLSFILLIVFFGSIYQSTILPFINGIEFGSTVIDYQLNNKQKTNNFVGMDVVSKNSITLDETDKNLKTGENVLIRPDKLTIIVNSNANKTLWIKILQSIYTLLGLVTIALGIWIPFLILKVFRSLRYSRFFDRLNLIWINRIGIILLIVGLLKTLIQVVNVYIAESIVELTHYTFSYARIIDYSPIMTGLIILIMNEVLRIGTKMKNGQDLTN